MKKMVFYSSLIISSTIYLCFSLYMYLYPSTYSVDSSIESLISAFNIIVLIVFIYSVFKAIKIMNKD